jgi:hypothetical protein
MGIVDNLLHFRRTAKITQNGKSSDDGLTARKKLEKTCEELASLIKEGDINAIVGKHAELVGHYYIDVRMQALNSFTVAKFLATCGFVVLILTLLYVVSTDLLSRMQISAFSMAQPPLSLASPGIVSGVLIEFIAGINFWLYARASKQFSAFHICLERTNRYLVAYKIAVETQEKKDEILEKLVCIMANAPMITHQDIDAVGSEPRIAQSTRAKAVSAEVA